MNIMTVASTSAATLSSATGGPAPVSEVTSAAAAAAAGPSELSVPQSVRSWLSSKHPKELAQLDKFEMELRLGRLSTSSTAASRTDDSDTPNAAYEVSTNYAGIANNDRRLVTFRTVELLRSLIGTTKWKNAAQLMVLLRGLGQELHAAGGFREPAIGNIVRRIMCAVRQEVVNMEEQAAHHARASAVQVAEANSNSTSEAQEEMQPIDEHLAHTFHTSNTTAGSNANAATTSTTAGGRRQPSLVNLWTYAQHPQSNNNKHHKNKQTRRTDSFSSVDSSSDPLDQITSADMQGFPCSFYDKHAPLRGNIMEFIQEIMSDLEDLHKNIDEQAGNHLHEGEVVLCYGRSKTVESFLKAAAKKRKFQVIVCEGAPHFGGHRMASSLADAGVDTTVIHDSAIFAIMARVNKVLLPAHAVLANGGLIAPSGCNMVAQAAANNAVPMISITGMFKLCPMYPHEGQNTLQDFVSPSSVVDYREISDDLMSKVELINPVHDYITPQLIDLYITNIGAFQPSYIYRLLAEYYHTDDWESFE